MSCNFCAKGLFSCTCSICANICHEYNKQVMKDCMDVNLKIIKYEKTLPCDGIYTTLKNIETYPIFCWHLSESFQCVLLFLQISVLIPQQAFLRQLSLTQRLHSVSSWKLSTQGGWSELGPGLVLPFFWKLESLIVDNDLNITDAMSFIHILKPHVRQLVASTNYYIKLGCYILNNKKKQVTKVDCVLLVETNIYCMCISN